MYNRKSDVFREYFDLRIVLSNFEETYMFKKIFGRILIVVPAIAIQVLWYLLIFKFFNNIFNDHLIDFLNIVLKVLAVLFVLGIVARRDESSYKLLWVIVIVAMPILGSILYFFLGNKRTARHIDKKISKAQKSLGRDKFCKEENVISEVKDEDPRLMQSLNYLCEDTNFPMLYNESVKYYPFGERVFEDMCKDLKNAKNYVYIEYFILEKGKFWDTLVNILAKKAQDGVDVRVIYDDLGSIGTYSRKEVNELKAKGIKCVAFNPFLFIRTQLNNRTHRKIMVIDGEVAYSGGINIADEYINAIQPYGVWKDIGFRLTGKSVEVYRFMFMEFWNAINPSNLIIPTPIPNPSNRHMVETPTEADGYILPYYDSPERNDHTSNILYTEILSQATDYVWFYTPYLMLGDALFDAFIRAAKRGVDVRLITPGVSDSKLVHRISRGYYKELLKAGVKIYEYTPGFVHAKAFISDDKIAGVGTVNLDYRSLFLHYECSSIFYKSHLIEDLKKDYLETQSECMTITVEQMTFGPFHRLIDNILRLISPLL